MRDIFVEIWESIRRNKLRTCLTGFAVAWGIFMLITLLGAGNGIMNIFDSNSEGLDVNTMRVYGNTTSKPYGGFKQGRYIELDEYDLKLTASPVFADHIDEISATLSQSGFKMTYGKRYFDVSLNGVYPDVERLYRIEMLAGRFINRNDIENRRKVIVLTHLHARNFLGGKENYESLIGQRVKIGNLSFKIIGVRHGAENENDTEIYTPFTTLSTIFSKSNRIDMLSFTFHGLDTEEENEAFEKDYKRVLNNYHGAAPDDERAIWISNSFTMNMQMNKGRHVLDVFLWIIGLFTLLSGIVGVSNIMLITVKERTHEFGIRKAIGAGPWSIMKLIIAESVSITAFFGYIGMVLGMVACRVLDATLGSKPIEVLGESITIMENPSVGLGVALEATILLIVAGTLAGLIPASKASRVKPIEALRAE
ncbi:MAG: ABC transporter permease [Bacteroidales bacterium]|jgi:putative ABC transport system permease protein|nr:ABC transporter permease [Bacteroidales bacterium]